MEAGAYVKSHKLEISQMICRRHEIQNTFDCQNVSERLTVTRMSYLPDLKPQGEMWVGRLRGSEHERIDPGSMCIIVKVANCLGNDGGYYEMVVRVYIRTTLLHVIGGVRTVHHKPTNAYKTLHVKCTYIDFGLFSGDFVVRTWHGD